MAWVFEHSRSTLADRLVLLAITDHANHEGRDAWPSVDHLARKAHVSRATVYRCVAALVEAGELEVVVDGCGPRRKRSYKVLMSSSQIETMNVQQSQIETESSQFENPSLYLNHPEPSFRACARETLLGAFKPLTEIVPTATLKYGERIR